MSSDTYDQGIVGDNGPSLAVMLGLEASTTTAPQQHKTNTVQLSPLMGNQGEERGSKVAISLRGV